MHVYYDELKNFENDFNDTTIIESLKYRKFTAPNYKRDSIQQKITTWASLCTPIEWETREIFGTMAYDERTKLIGIARQYKCQIEIEEKTTTRICDIPKAVRQDHISNKLTATAIEIRQDDLAEQEVMKLRLHTFFLS